MRIFVPVKVHVPSVLIIIKLIWKIWVSAYHWKLFGVPVVDSRMCLVLSNVLDAFKDAENTGMPLFTWYDW